MALECWDNLLPLYLKSYYLQSKGKVSLFLILESDFIGHLRIHVDVFPSIHIHLKSTCPPSRLLEVHFHSNFRLRSP